jgi:predicted DCC family thiol-disulfide oxidoreductase YuxK
MVLERTARAVKYIVKCIFCVMMVRLGEYRDQMGSLDYRPMNLLRGTTL